MKEKKKNSKHSKTCQLLSTQPRPRSNQKSKHPSHPLSPPPYPPTTPGHAAKFATPQTATSYATTPLPAPIFQSTAANTNLSGTVAPINTLSSRHEKMNWYQPMPRAPRPAISHVNNKIDVIWILDFGVEGGRTNSAHGVVGGVGEKGAGETQPALRVCYTVQPLGDVEEGVED